MADTEKKNMDTMIDDRNRTIVRTSVIGIAANVLLAGFKAVVGVVTNSIAVTLDAVNNLSDALSSVITIVGAKLSAKSPDKKHPMGYGRIEYMSALVVAFIVLYAGITSGVESVKKIFHPESADYSTVSLVIIGAAVVVKFFLGRYVKAKGEKVNSQALVASGSDASFDAILSLSVFVSALVYIFFSISLEAYVGAVISCFIIKAGIEMMLETVNDILGHRTDAELTKQIKDIACAEPEVYGAYDLFLNNYGPNRNYASMHVELPDTMDVEHVDELTRRLQVKIHRETGVILTGLGVYSFNTRNEEAARIRNDVQKIVMGHDWALQMHGFYADTEKRTVRFDVVLSFDMTPKEALGILQKELGDAYPGYRFTIIPDTDLTD
ncbi:MAG: cation transporter [Spirochaetales bacterium]|nr:cation transporter [Spirochaetales bacterium]